MTSSNDNTISEQKKNRLKVSYVTLMAVCSTWLIVDRCYIPGRSPWMVLGLLLWIVTCVCWIVSSIRIGRNLADLSRSEVLSRFLTVPILLAISVLGITSFPETWGFQFSRAALDQFVSKHSTERGVPSPRNHLNKGAPLGLQVGVYSIMDYAVDENGGVYLVTTEGGDGIGPDTTSSGFVFKPSKERSPFGSKYYDPTLIMGDWCTFEASNDF